MRAWSQQSRVWLGSVTVLLVMTMTTQPSVEAKSTQKRVVHVDRQKNSSKKSTTKMRGKKVALLAAGGVVAGVATVSAAKSDVPNAYVRGSWRETNEGQAEVKGFARQMVTNYPNANLDLNWIEGWIGQANYSEKALRFTGAFSMPTSTGAGSWSSYRARFIEPARIQAGRQFYERWQTTLQKAEQTYQVPAEIIAAIMGIETIYGKSMGDFKILDVLTTLAFEHPRRKTYFRSELEQFLLLARERGEDPSQYRGSFAGAIGIPQFMPGSIRNYAVDFDGDGRIDLVKSFPDAIGSVANFLKQHGWQGRDPALMSATVGVEREVLAWTQGIYAPKWTIAEIIQNNVQIKDSDRIKWSVDKRFYIIDLPEKNLPTLFYVASQNFYTITRYNRSYFYAMSVLEFAQQISGIQWIPN